MQILKKIHMQAGERRMRTICVLTHVDLVDPAIDTAVQNFEGSSAVKSIKDYVSHQLGINPNQARLQSVHCLLVCLNAARSQRVSQG